MIKLAQGEVSFRGHYDQGDREEFIAVPIIKKMLEQVVKYCLMDAEPYLIKWEICRGVAGDD